jgi:uncharacterized membrane protein
MQFARWLHVMGVVVWVGGMFFAHVALRPSVQSLAPPERLPLLAATLSRFIAWVAVSIVAILASGVAMMTMIPAGGPYVHAMVAGGLAMTAVYLYIVAVPAWPRRTGRARARRCSGSGSSSQSTSCSA